MYTIRQNNKTNHITGLRGKCSAATTNRSLYDGDTYETLDDVQRYLDLSVRRVCGICWENLLAEFELEAADETQPVPADAGVTGSDEPDYVVPAEEVRAYWVHREAKTAQVQPVETVVQVQDSFVIRTEDATLAHRIMTLLEGSDRFNYPQILLEAVRQEAQAELDRQQADPEPPVEVIAMQHNEHVTQARCGDDEVYAVSTNGVWRIPGSGIAGCDLDDVLRAWAIRLGHLGDVAIVRKS